MAGAQQVSRVADGLVGEQGQALGRDLEDRAAFKFASGNVIRSQQAIGSWVLAEGQEFVVGVAVHWSP